MNTLVFAFFILFASALVAEPVRYRIYTIDPRGVHFTEHHLPTFFEDKRADVIGSRNLTNTESEMLAGFLKEELSKSTDVPFCGHSPGYLVEVTQGSNRGGMVTLCGLCGTWSGRSGVFALSGGKSLTYLDELLPLPEVFKSLNGGELFIMDKSKPFYEVQKPKMNEPNK
jgi:hypothetical protein